jgi:hypothetical protein
MSLLIIVYLAIVLILVLVTMLLLRWHKVLRTPLEVIRDSRVHHGTAAPTSVMEDTEAVATTSAPATVSIMVMYRPNKPRSLVQPASVELPPSYDSLFMGDSPPSYNFVRVNAASLEVVEAVFDQASSQATASSEDEAIDISSASNSMQAPPPTPVAEVSSTEAVSSSEVADEDSHCQCDCDHSKCHNASNLK